VAPLTGRSPSSRPTTAITAFVTDAKNTLAAQTTLQAVAGA
jgi:hypothetical protein